MIHTWQLQEAKNKLSKVVANALSDGPQVITRRGQEVAIVISFAEYQQLLASREPLSVFFRCSPLAGVDLDLERDRSAARAGIEL